MKTLLFTFLVVLLSTAGSVPMAAQEPYAMFTEADSTLTFYYDTQRATRSGIPYVMPTKWNDPAWAGTWDSPQAGIRHAVFDASFAGYRPTTLMSWFRYLGSLQDIKGLQNLNTERVTSMLGMFYCCESLTSLDLSHFNTAKVTDMSCLFVDCKSLTSLDLSHFNTENVTNMGYMFCGNVSLTSIYCNDDWSKGKVEEDGDMFTGCTNLQGTRAEYDDTKTGIEMANPTTGYFAPADCGCR